MITFQFETKYALFGDNLLYKNDLIKDVFMPSLKGNTQCISFLNLNPINARHLFHERVDVSVCALF